MTVEHYRLLFKHNAWANDRVTEQIANLGYDRAREPAGLDLGDGSIIQTLVHLLHVEESWYTRCLGNASSPELTVEAAGTIETIRERLAGQASAWMGLLEEVEDPALDELVSNPSRTSDRIFSHPLWTRLSHVLSHSTQHRGELALATSRLGHSPCEPDFLEYYEFFT